jgi:hypothetical protein
MSEIQVYPKTGVIHNYSRSYDNLFNINQTKINCRLLYNYIITNIKM